MASIPFTSSMTSSTCHHHRRRPHPFPLRRPHLPTRPTPTARTARAVARAAKSEEDSNNWYRPARDSGTVDENMIVLRKRMRDMEAAERNYDEPPPHWAGWEKRWHSASYGSDVCGLAGMIQTLLMNARPGVGVGLVALAAVSVPTSAVLMLMHLLDAAARSAPAILQG